MEQLNSIESNSIFEIIIHKYKCGLMIRWKACLAAGGGSKRRYQYCSDDTGKILYLRALQGHSGNNLVDPTFTGRCGDWDWNLPLHLPHRMRFQSSFYYQQWIDTWRSRLGQKTNSILLAR